MGSTGGFSCCATANVTSSATKIKPANFFMIASLLIGTFCATGPQRSQSDFDASRHFLGTCLRKLPRRGVSGKVLGLRCKSRTYGGAGAGKIQRHRGLLGMPPKPLPDGGFGPPWHSGNPSRLPIMCSNLHLRAPNPPGKHPLRCLFIVI